MKKILPLILIAVGLGLIGYYFVFHENLDKDLIKETGEEQTEQTTNTTTDEQIESTANDNARISAPTTSTEVKAGGKLKADTFTGKLEQVNTGCFADGECYIVVDGKHITTLRGWSQDIVGTVFGADGIGGLESHIGENVEVYAQDRSDGTYTLYGSEGFYVKLK